MTIYRNASAAFLSELRELVDHGDVVRVRGALTRERRARLLTLEHPEERYIVLPHRNNDVFAAIAETVWVLAGRNDLAFLRPYLPRADDFSDDGSTWRAGYGPRLRNWHGSDQIAQAVRALREDPESRRAVLTLFDPSEDFEPSLDIPCTNWLHFLLRDGRLEMSVTVRSNDIWWGFSGVNTFEWSVLHEAMAHWVDAKLGPLHYFASSLHLYERHFTRARTVLAATPPAPTRRARAEFTTPWNDLDDVLGEWFRLEQALRDGSDPHARLLAFPDPLLRQFLLAIRVKWLSNDPGTAVRVVDSAIAELGDTDVAVAVTERMHRASLRRAHDR